ncbi:MAG: hypothetical protein ABIJ09_09370 [Pseudomonadota bacterium]
MLDFFSDPFRGWLGPLADHASDPEVSHLLADGETSLLVERRGQLQTIEGALPAGALESIARAVAADAGLSVDSRLLRGQGQHGQELTVLRMEAGEVPHLALSLPPRQGPDLDMLVDADVVPALALPLLRAAVAGRRGILLLTPPPAVDGGLLAALVQALTPQERVVVLIAHPGMAPLVPGCIPLHIDASNAAELLPGVLALRPDRAVAPWLDATTAPWFLQAATGLAGSMARGTAVDARSGLAQLVALACAGGMDAVVARTLCDAALSLVVVVGRLPDKRLAVVEIDELVPSVEGSALSTLFHCVASDDDDAAVPVLVPTGRIPSFLPSLVPLGARLDPALFDPSRHGLPAAAEPTPPAAPTAAPNLAPPVIPPLPSPMLRRGLVDASVGAAEVLARDVTPDPGSDNDDPGWEVEVMDRSNHGRSAQDLSTEGPATPPACLVGAPVQTSFEAILRAKQGAAAAPRGYNPHPPPLHPMARELGLEPPPDTTPPPDLAQAEDVVPDDETPGN